MNKYYIHIGTTNNLIGIVYGDNWQQAKKEMIKQGYEPGKYILEISDNNGFKIININIK